MLLYLKEVDCDSGYSVDNFISVAEIHREVVRPAKGNAMCPFQRNEWSVYEVVPFNGIPGDLLEAQDSETLDGFPEIHFIV